MIRCILIALAIPGLLLCCSKSGRYDEHASQTMNDWADGNPTRDLPPDAPLPVEEATAPAEEGAPESAPTATEEPAIAEESPAVSEPVPSPATGTDSSVTEAAPPAQVKPGGAAGPNPPEFLRPETEKVTSPVEVLFLLQEGQELKAGGTATVRFEIVPGVDAAEARVRYEVQGPAEVTPPTSTIGAAKAGAPLLASAQVQLNEGRSEVRAWAEGYGPGGEQVFARSMALYFIVQPEKVLAGPNSYQALERLELERQRDAGEISPEDFTVRMRVLTYGGATTNAEVHPPR